MFKGDMHSCITSKTRIILGTFNIGFQSILNRVNLNFDIVNMFSIKERLLYKNKFKCNQYDLVFKVMLTG